MPEVAEDVLPGHAVRRDTCKRNIGLQLSILPERTWVKSLPPFPFLTKEDW